MQTGGQFKWMTVIALAAIFLSVLALVMLIPQFIATINALANPGSSSSTTQTLATVTPTDSPQLIRARTVLARVRDEIIPREGRTTSYGVTFSDAGYQTLTQWNNDVKVDEHCADRFESLNLRLPCCEWETPSRNEEKNCACGHHQALEGLSKKLLHDGWDKEQVQQQVTLWARFMYPAEALAAEMERRAQLDPEIKQVLEELKARGEC
jgi:hypothetical protein